MATFWSSIGLPTRDAEPLAGFEVIEWNPPGEGRRIPGHYTDNGNAFFLRFLQLHRGYYTVNGASTAQWRWRVLINDRDSTSGLSGGDDLSTAVEGQGLTLYHVRETGGSWATRRSITLDLSSPDNTEPYQPAVNNDDVRRFVQGYRDDRPGLGGGRRGAGGGTVPNDYFVFRIRDGQTLSMGSGRINRSGQVGENLRYQIRAASGWPSGITYSTSGTLPPGITFNAATRTFSGVPTTAGAWDVTVTARVSQGVLQDTNSYTTTETASRVIRFTIADITPTLTVRAISDRTSTANRRTSFVAGGVDWNTEDSPTRIFYTATGLPPGITLTDGTIFSGTPTTAGTYTVVYTATAAGYVSDSETFTWTISETPFLTLGTALDRSGLSGDTINFRGPSAFANTGSPTITYRATGLPPGVSFNTSTRRFTGAPTAGGDYTIEYEASATGYIGARLSFSWTVTDRILTVGAISNRSNPAGAPINAFFGPRASANTGNPTVTYTASDLPPGISFNRTTRRFSGTPTTTGTYICNYAVSATNYRSATRSFRWEITTAKILTLGGITDKSSTAGTTISAFTGPTASASTGSPTITYSVSGLPAGLNFNRNNRRFSGTPSTEGVSTVTYTATATGYASASVTFRWNVSDFPSLSLTSIGSKSGYTNAQISAFDGPVATPSRGSPTVTYTASGMPPGITFNASNRRFSGAPTAAGTYTVGYRATATGYTSAREDFSWTVTESQLSLPAIGNQTATRGTAISALTIAAASANRGSPTVTYSASGTPAGISFSSSQRRFTGAPTTSGTSTVTVTASATGYVSASRSFTWTVSTAPALSLSTISGLSGYTGDTVSFTGPAASANTGSPTVTYSVTGLPPGVSFNAGTRAFSGAPTTAGDYTVSYTASASGYASASRSFSWEVTGKSLSVAFIQTQNTTVDTAATTLTGPAAVANTGSPTITYSATGLPDGISFSASNRQFSGTPTAAGTFTVTYRARATGYSDGTTTFTWNVNAAPRLSLPGIRNRTGTEGSRTTFTAPVATANTGSPSISYSATGLPPGITRSGRILSGTPTQAGTYTVSYTASASGYTGATETFTWTIQAALALSLTSIGDRSDPANAAITNWTGPSGTANRGSPSVSYRAAPLPPGITFNSSSRVFSGTPTQTGSWVLTYRAAASGYITSRTQFTWTITSAQSLSLAEISDRSSFRGVEITAWTVSAATASTGSPTITYSVSGLPAGVSFDASTRQISGTPTTAGTSTVTITAAAADYTTATRTFTWTVTQRALSLAAIADQNATAGTAISALTIAAAAANTGSPTVTYTASGTPPGLAFSASERQFTGSPTTAGTYTVTLTATSPGYTSASRSFTWTVAITPALSLGSIADQSGHTGDTITAFSAPAATANTGSPTVSYAADGLPPGIAFSTPGHQFSGAPTTAGSYTVTITATASGYTSATTTFGWTVLAKTLTFTSFVTDRTSTAGNGISSFTGPGASANTGSPTVTYAASGLPPGVSFNASTRWISGTPTTAGSYTVTLTATADGYESATETFDWTINENPTLTFSGTILDRVNSVGDSIPAALVGPTATANIGSPTIVYTCTGMPPGIRFWQSRRRWLGSPTQAGTWTVTYSAHARTGNFNDAIQTFQWTIRDRTLTLGEDIPDQTSTEGRLIDGLTGPEATPSTGSPTITYAVNGLPPGITFTPGTRQFTGRPTETGSHTVVYHAHADGYASASDAFEWNVNLVPAATIGAGTKMEASTRGFGLAGRLTAGTSVTARLRSGVEPAATFGAGTSSSANLGAVLTWQPRVTFETQALDRRAVLQQGGSASARFQAGSQMRPTIVTFGAPGFQILDIGTPSVHSVVAGVQLLQWDLTIGTPQWQALSQTLVQDGSLDTYIEQLSLSWQPAEYDDSDTKIADSEARVGVYLTGSTDFTRQLEDAASAFAFEAPALDLLVIPGLGQITGTDPHEPYVYRFTGTTADTIGDWIEQYSALTPQALSGTRFVLDDNRRNLVGVFTSAAHAQMALDQVPDIVELEPAATFECGAKQAEVLFERSSLRGHSQEFVLDDRDIYLNGAGALQWAPTVSPDSFLSPAIDSELVSEPSFPQGLILIGFSLPPQYDPKVSIQTIGLPFAASRDLSLAFESFGVLTFECGDGSTTNSLVLRIGFDIAADYTHPYNLDTLSDAVTQRIIDWVTAWRALPEGGRNCRVTLTAPNGQFMSFRMTAGTQVNPPIHQQSERRVVVEKYASAGTGFSPAITHSKAFSAVSSRLYRYAIHIPGTDRGRSWSFWSGDDAVEIGNVLYSAGQWASFEDGAPVSGIHSTQLGGVEAMTLRFAATGLFRTWLLSGDAAGRIASVYSVAAEGTAWVIKNEVVRGRIGDTRTLTNGLIETEFSAAARSTANYPSVITYGVHKSEFEGDTSARFSKELDAGFKVEFP